MRILVPIDFSLASQTALELALALCDGRLSQITLLHVDAMPSVSVLSVEPLTIPPSVWESVRKDQRASTERRLDALKDQLIESADATLEVTSRVAIGSTVDSICSAASDINANFIVMGSHGATGAERFFFGSTAEAVSRQAAVPVLVTRHQEEPSKKFMRVLVGVDHSEFSRPLVELAATMVAPSGYLRLAHVIHQPYLGPVDVAVSNVSEELRAAVADARAAAVDGMNAFKASLDMPGIHLEAVVEDGAAEAKLLELSEQADLVVIGAHGHERLGERFLGTTADRVLRHCKVPVLLLPESAVP